MDMWYFVHILCARAKLAWAREMSFRALSLSFLSPCWHLWHVAQLRCHRRCLPMTRPVCWCRRIVCGSVSQTSDIWYSGYPLGKQDKATCHRCRRLWLWLSSNQFLQHVVLAKENECLLLLVWTAARPLPPIHLHSSWRLPTMPCLAAFLCIAVVSTRQPRNRLCLSCWRNCSGIFSTGVCCFNPCKAFCTEGLCLHPGLVFQNLWWTAAGSKCQRQHQPHHSVHPHTVPWTRRTLSVVQICCCYRSSFVPDPFHQWFHSRLMELR